MTASLVDANVLVYAYDRDEPRKQSVALKLLEQLAEDDALVVSTRSYRSSSSR